MTIEIVLIQTAQGADAELFMTLKADPRILDLWSLPGEFQLMAVIESTDPSQGNNENLRGILLAEHSSMIKQMLSLGTWESMWHFDLTLDMLSSICHSKLMPCYT